MNDDQYYEIISSDIIILNHLCKKAKKIAIGVSGNTLFIEDLFFLPSIDRAIQITKGFIQMLNERNLTCAGVLLRIQMDNCMRTYAAFISEDYERFVFDVIKGEKIKNMYDKNGNKMTDHFLKKELTKIDADFEKVYTETSGYVHFSNKAIFHTISPEDEGKLSFNIAYPPSEKVNIYLKECSSAFINYLDLNLEMFQAVANNKNNYEMNLGLKSNRIK